MNLHYLQKYYEKQLLNYYLEIYKLMSEMESYTKSDIHRRISRNINAVK